MPNKPTIGSEDWKEQIIKNITHQINGLLSDHKDMRALRLSDVLDELKIYFKQSNNESENRIQ